jgi:hypothetical protein
LAVEQAELSLFHLTDHHNKAALEVLEAEQAATKLVPVKLFLVVLELLDREMLVVVGPVLVIVQVAVVEAQVVLVVLLAALLLQGVGEWDFQLIHM